MSDTKYTHFDKDGKLQQGLNPIIDHGFIQVGKVELQPTTVYSTFSCPHGVFRCGDNVLCGDCQGFTEPCQKCEGLKALLADVFPVIDDALNQTYFYPSRDEDGDKAMDARARLFELRDKIESRLKAEGIK